MAKFLEHFKLNWKFVGFSKRLAIVTIIGLSISVGMVTQSILFLNSFRTNAFTEFALTTTESYIEADIEHVGTFGFNVLGQIEYQLNRTLSESGVQQDELLGQEWLFYKFFFLLLFNEKFHENEFQNTYMVGIDSEYLGYLEPLMTVGEAPEENQYCMITSSQVYEETNLDVNQTFEGYVKVNDEGNPWDSYSAGAAARANFEFTGIINIDDVYFGNITLPPQLQTIVSMVFNLGTQIIVTDNYRAVTLVHNIPEGSGNIGVNGRILFNLNNFNVFQLDGHIDTLQVAVNKIQEELINIIQVYSSNYDLGMAANIIPLLSGFKSEFRIFQIFIMVFMLPTLIMSLVLTSFATNQVKKQRERQIQNLHQRGASRQMLFGFMLLELVIYAGLAVIAGLLIGWPYTMIALSSEGFFSFSNASFPAIQWDVIGISIGIGFGIAFLANIPSIWQRSKTSAEEALQEQKEKKPFWERFYIDVFLLIMGIIMWLVSSAQLTGSSATTLEFAFFFAAPAPILIIIGAIMLATRIYPPVVKWFSDLLFKIPKIEINAISARNAIRRKVSTNRTIILMTITFTLTVSSMIIPDSYTAYDLESAYYDLGADIVVQQVDVQDSAVKEKIANITGVEAVSYVSLLELTNSESDLVYQIKILGVEFDNYSKVAYSEPEYTNGRGIGNILSSINNSNEVVGQRDQTALLSLGENTTFIIKNSALEGPDVVEKLYPVKFVDFYEYWPTLFQNVPNPTSKEINIGMISNITLPFTIARYETDVDGKALVKVKEGFNIADVAEEIEISTRLNTQNVQEEVLISSGSLKATVLFGSLNSSFILSMVIASATLLTMMIIHAIERERELAVMKSMGISFGQLFNFFITEAVIVLFFTMIIGVGLGVGTSVMIMKILRIGSVYPPHEMVFPITKVLWTTLAIFASGLISTIIPVVVNSRKEVSGALKAI